VYLFKSSFLDAESKPDHWARVAVTVWGYGYWGKLFYPYASSCRTYLFDRLRVKAGQDTCKVIRYN
jgi:hypothetical protein